MPSSAASADGTRSVEMTPAEVARQIVKTSNRQSFAIDPLDASKHPQDIMTIQQKKKKHEMDDVVEEVYIGDTTWAEVCQACFVHTPMEWLNIFGSLVAFLGCLYVFGLGLDLMSSGAKVMAGCAAGKLFGSSVNPVAGVMVGILATVLLQSSSTTTSIIVGLVGAEDSVFTVEQGIYMIMGANIGTTITNTIVSLLQFQNQKQLADAFASATIHDIFNFLTVAILLPLEVLTGYLSHLTAALVRGANTEDGDKWEGPVKKIISPLGKKILIANKAVTNTVAGGGQCQDFYPIECEDVNNPTYDTCDTGLIACEKSTNSCPAFFDPNAGIAEDQSAGLVVLCMGLFLIFVSLVMLVQVMTRLLRGVSLRVIHKATELNGYILIFIGTGITTFLQSSSTTTSFLTPVAGIGALRLEQMYPLTIGANIGTTVTAVLAAMSTDGDEALQVALAHLMFNVTGMMIWYPIESVRAIPVMFSRRLGQYTRVWRPFALLYLLGTFFVLPTLCLGLSALFLNESKAATVIGSLLTAFLGIVLIVFVRWFYFLGGRAKFYKYLSQKHEQYLALQTLTTDMEKIKAQVEFHEEYVGFDPSKHKKLETGEGDRLTISVENPGLSRSQRTNPSTDVRVVHDMDAYAEKKEKFKKAVAEALDSVSDDIAFLQGALFVLNHHTGLKLDGQDDDDEDDEEDASHDGEEGDSSGRSPSLAPSKLFSMGSREVNFITLWAAVPKIYVFGLAAVVAITIGGIIALFKNGGKAATGAAYFLIGVSGIALLWAGFSLDPVALHDYFRNQDREKRQETINSLPREMKPLKRRVRRLLEHYKLEVDDLLGSSHWETLTYES